MKRILILLTVLSCIMTVACSSDAEELGKKEEPKVEPKDTTDTVITDTVTYTTPPRWTRNIFFYDEPVDVAELPKWIIHNADSLSREYPNGLDVYRTLYKRDTVYIAMTATSPFLPIYNKKGNLMSENFDPYFYSREWKRIYSWRPDNWNESLENDISDSRIFKRTIYIPDELVDTTALPAWTAHDIYYYTKEAPIGIDIYRGEYENDTIYMTMTMIYDYPYFFDKNGERLYTDAIYWKSTNWKRIYFRRPDNWDRFYEYIEGNMFVLRFFLR